LTSSPPAQPGPADPPGSAAQAGPSPAEILRDYDPFAQAALAPFGFSPAARLSLLSLSENATYRVDDPAGDSRPGDSGAGGSGTGGSGTGGSGPGATRTAVLRVHRTGYHPDGAVASELAWLQALRAETGLRTPAVFPAADGREVVDITIGPVTRQVVLFEWLPGAEPAEDQLPEKFELLGEICGRMHQHSRGWTRPASFVRFSWDYDTCVGATPRWGRWQDGIGVGPDEHATLTRAAGVMQARLARFGKSADRFGLIHADMRLANLLVNGPDIQVIDFDDCGFGWFLFDLGASLSFIEHDPRVPGLCEAWLRGYRTVLPLPDADAAEIPTFILLRRLQLVAWVGSHRFADSARELGAEFTAGACELAERYLSGMS
jgi:Ser/Thr protein kinase RdoA (MazF antagonist)